MSAADGRNRSGRRRSQSLHTPTHRADDGWTPSPEQLATGETALCGATPIADQLPRPSDVRGINVVTRAQFRRDRKRIARQKWAFRVGPGVVAATVLVGTGGLAGATSVAAGTTPLTSQVVSMTAFSTTASHALEGHVAKNVAPALSENLTVALADTSDVAATVPKQAAEALSEVASLAHSTEVAVTESTTPVEVEAPKATSREGAQTQASRSSSRSTASSTEYVAPISGATITSGYAMRWGRMHNGMDFAAPIGHSINAVGSGIVTNGYSANGRGIYVTLLLDDGTEVSYGHMSKSSVSDGQRVNAGDVVGLVGNTGRSTGPHMHFEVRMPGGTRVNPAPWLAQQGLL